MFASEDDQKNEELSCLKIMAFNHKNSKFRDKRTEMLDNVKRQSVPTRCKLRIKFPDSYVLQGTFGARETVQAVYDYVKENIVTKERGFYLFETPPKKVLKDKKQTLFKAKFGGMAIIYFGWSDVD